MLVLIRQKQQEVFVKLHSTSQERRIGPRMTKIDLPKEIARIARGRRSKS
jgi:hypothetical protein